MSSFPNCASDPDAGPPSLHRLKNLFRCSLLSHRCWCLRCNYTLSRCLRSPLRLFMYLCSLLNLLHRLSSSLHLSRCLSSPLYLFSFLKPSKVILCFTWICIIKCKPQKLKDLTECSHLMTETY